VEVCDFRAGVVGSSFGSCTLYLLTGKWQSKWSRLPLGFNLPTGVRLWSLLGSILYRLPKIPMKMAHDDEQCN
jgi:hypothetical protein